MKCLRTMTATALAVMAVGPAVYAAGHCRPSLDPITVFPLVLCVEREATTGGNVNAAPAFGNTFPYSNNSANFSTYRNQYLYPSPAIVKLAKKALTIESIHARAASFAATGVQTHTYTATTNNYIKVELASATSLVKTFASNLTGVTAVHLDYEGPKTVTMTSAATVGGLYGGINTAPILSDFSSRPGLPSTRNDLDLPIDLRALAVTPGLPSTNILVDMIMGGTGGAGASAWDVTNGACSEPQRAYGSGAFANPGQHLTTALGVDANAFVWVFRGKILPPPSTIQQQIAEILRVLMTPDGLRCTGLDLTPDGRLMDEVMNFPSGKDYDPISPQVTNDGVITGEENGDGGQRRQGWKP